MDGFFNWRYAAITLLAAFGPAALYTAWLVGRILVA
jgi:hypothetical protein